MQIVTVCQVMGTDWLTMIWARAHMDDYSKEAVWHIHQVTLLCCVAQLELHWEHHTVHELAQPANAANYRNCGTCSRFGRYESIAMNISPSLFCGKRTGRLHTPFV